MTCEWNGCDHSHFPRDISWLVVCSSNISHYTTHGIWTIRFSFEKPQYGGSEMKQTCCVSLVSFLLLKFSNMVFYWTSYLCCFSWILVRLQSTSALSTARKTHFLRKRRRFLFFFLKKRRTSRIFAFVFQLYSGRLLNGLQPSNIQIES